MSAQHKMLFNCQHNSGRSQIAETYLKNFAGEGIVSESAGHVPAEKINPLVVGVMKEDGIDLSGKQPQNIFELFKNGIAQEPHENR